MNLVEKLKNVPAGTKLYSPMFKDPVEFVEITRDSIYPIDVKTSAGECHCFTKEGYYTGSTSPQNCMLFPTSEMTWERYTYIPDKQLVAWCTEGEIVQIACAKGGFYNSRVNYYWFYCIESDKIITNASMIYNEILDEQSTPIVKDILESKGYIIDGTDIIQCKFKKGDVIVSESGIIALFDSIKNSSRPDTIVYQAILRPYVGLKIAIDTGIGYTSNARLASPAEKERFFNALSEAGYSWNGEKIVPVFKKGDVVVSNGGCIAIVDHVGDFGTRKNVVYYQAVLDQQGNLDIKVDVGIGNVKNCTLASIEYKEKLLAKLVASGYNLVGDTVKPLEYKFTHFEKVLVRDAAQQNWKCDFFSHIDDKRAHFKFRCTGGYYYYCIPYNLETADLVGTNEPAPEKYQTQG